MKSVRLKFRKLNRVFCYTLIISFLFFSCIKKRTCICNVNGVFSSTATIQRTSKKKAEEKCKAYSAIETNGSNVYNRVCNLK
jgi:hypothetical protein